MIDINYFYDKNVDVLLIYIYAIVQLWLLFSSHHNLWDFSYKKGLMMEMGEVNSYRCYWVVGN